MKQTARDLIEEVGQVAFLRAIQQSRALSGGSAEAVACALEMREEYSAPRTRLIRPMDRALQRMKRAGLARFDSSTRRWVLTPAGDTVLAVDTVLAGEKS